jgi:cysteine-rich repeat protein
VQFRARTSSSLATRDVSLGAHGAALLLAVAAGCGDGDRLPAPLAASVTIISLCGDSSVDGTEECDDGNTLPGDGCSEYCEIEAEPADSSDDADADRDETQDPEGTLEDPAGAGGAVALTDASQDEPLCSAAPADACLACSCSACKPQLDACSKLNGTAAEGPLRGAAKGELCESLVRCSVAASCRSIACVCNPESTVTCLEGSTLPDGPCYREALAAAETRDVLTLLLRASMRDTGYAIAAASAFSSCSARVCADACEL